MSTTAAEALAALADTETLLLGGVELPPQPAAHAPAPAAAPAVAGPAEPIYDDETADDIQGHVIPGFNKDFQQFLFLRFGDVDEARTWLAGLAPQVATMRDVLGFRREFRARRLMEGIREPDMTSTWLAVAFSHRGISSLASAEQADAFGEESFRQGLSARSTYLGDATDPAEPGHRSNWVVGGPDNEADALVVLAADQPEDLRSAVQRVRDAAESHGISVQFSQMGATLPGELTGHEHFGFKDGISQPGVRGRLSNRPDDEITPRYLDSGSPHAKLFAKPGQSLVWPGQFLLGEPRQSPQDPVQPAEPAANFPGWARRGSYLVCRRLNQDVLAFWQFAADAGEQLGVSPVHFASTLVGRWPNGAPLMRSPETADAALAGDEFANNHFLYNDVTRPSGLRPINGYPGDRFANAAGDLFAHVCPHAAHIRKVNPRDSGTDFGTPADTLLRLMLRRGIPYGEPIAGVSDPSPELVAAERGLMFVAYMSSIEDQFEFVTRRWANSAVQPNLGGHDPVIGQRDSRGDRTRTVQVRSADGELVDLTLSREWVRPTGGGYFFAPPISALTGALAGRG
jgi:Dyp-type peroxidase family